MLQECYKSVRIMSKAGYKSTTRVLQDFTLVKGSHVNQSPPARSAGENDDAMFLP